MKIGMVNKLTIMNRFVFHTLRRNLTHLAVMTRKTNIKIDILKGGGSGKEPDISTSRPRGGDADAFFKRFDFLCTILRYQYLAD